MKKNNLESEPKTFLGIPMRWDAKNAFKGLWDQDDKRLFTPKHFGIGWSLNFHALLKSAGIIKSKPQERDLNTLPSDLPVPQDDGACDHLTNMEIPEIKRKRIMNLF